MFIEGFVLRLPPRGSVQVKLPHKGLIVDPRANRPTDCIFRIDYHDDDITATLTRTDDEKETYFKFTVRVYDPTIEDVPKFDSGVYTYMGLKGECVPLDTTCAFIHPSVKTIHQEAFEDCDEMKQCIMQGDNIETIAEEAFSHCWSLEGLILPRSLKKIGSRAFRCCRKMKRLVMYDGIKTIEEGVFEDCRSLEAMFLPSSVTEIGRRAFCHCKNLRILPLPINMNIQKIDREAFLHCDALFDMMQIQRFGGYFHLDRLIYRHIIDSYRGLPPIYRACLDVNVSAQSIKDCTIRAQHGSDGSTSTFTIRHFHILGMSPLHILAMNPHANPESIFVCFGGKLDGVLEKDRWGNSPLDYSRKYNVRVFLSLVQALCIHREAHFL
mmetsp:Transcript_5858/g.6750  ORF Transcript_5858/g.6750 Transcript_5858/m.6750 type:complete len:382 (+) Transcript_5858:62-1207(+)